MIRVFVSSTYLDLKDHRAAVHSIIVRAGMHPVGMEDFGSRPDEPVIAALQEVDRSNVFIGIYAHRYGSVRGHEEQSVTEQELDRALALGLPFYAYLVDPAYVWPPEFIDSGLNAERLTALIRKVEASTTRSRFTSPDSLAAAVAADLARHPYASRVELLTNNERLSVARCKAAWQSVDLPDDVAGRLADDRNIGAPPAEYRPSPEKPLVVLIGGKGAGKSLLGERLLQEAIERARQDPSAPVPVMIRALPHISSLVDEVVRLSEGIGDPHRRGAAVVVEAGEVLSSSYYLELLANARALLDAWKPASTVVLLSRPLQVQKSETVAIAPLSIEQSARLVNLAAGTDVFSWVEPTLPRSIRKSIDRPLFALLLGAYVRRTGGLRPGSTSHLIADLAEALLERMGPSREPADAFLRSLAEKTIDRAGGPVPVRELNLNRADVDRLLATGVVITQDDAIRFTLPVLADWFAAETIRRQEASIARIAESVEMVERWRYPLAVLCRVSSSSIVDDVMGRLSRTHPGQAAGILKDAGDAEASTIQEDPIEIGRRVHAAMSAWLEGIDTLAMRTPWTKDGRILKLGVGHVEKLGMSPWPGGLMSLGWGEASTPDDVFKLPSVIDPRDQMRFSRFVGLQPGGDPLWPWRWTLHDVSEWLRDHLVRNPHQLLLELPLPQREQDWQYARTVTRWREAPVPLTELKTALEKRSPPYIENTEVQTRARLAARVGQLLADGANLLPPPWPLADIPHETWTWLRFSNERTIQRTRAVLEGAVQTYRSAVETLFPRFAKRFHMAQNLPARIEAWLALPDRSDPAKNFPAIRVRFHSLRDHQDTVLDLRVDSGASTWLSASEFQVASAHLRGLRSMDVHWLYPVVFDSVLDIYSDHPVTELAARWLASDLRDCGWLS